MTPRPAALDALEAAAQEAGAAETAYRAHYAREILRLETERRRAYRRFSFLGALIAADADALDREASQAAQRKAAASELDWDDVDPTHAAALDALEPLADAVHDERLVADGETEPQDHADRAAGLLLALADFEARFEAARGQPLVVAFDRYMPETPLVDF